MPAPRGRTRHTTPVSERAARAWTTSYRAARVLPIATAPIANGAVVVENGKIVWVGRAGDEPSISRARVVELGDSVLAPGLVNAHTHLDLTVAQGLFDGLTFFEWIRAVLACRGELSHDQVLDSARLGVIRGLEAGITTFADTAPFDAPFRAMIELGVRGIAFVEVFGPDPSVATKNVAELRARIRPMRDSATKLVSVGVSPHAPYSVSNDLYVAAAAMARAEGLPMATHLAESADESELVKSAGGPFADLLRSRDIAVEPRADSPVALLDQLGVLGPDMLLIHCVRCGADDIASIVRSGASVATCPRSNSYFAHGKAPAAAMRRAGARLGVGSDSLASNESMDMMAEAAEALAGDPSADTAEHWRLATLGGASALGLDGRIGTIEIGKEADLAAFPLGGAGADMAGYPSLAVNARASLAVVAGVERVREGRIVGDPGATIARAAEAAQQLREWRARETSA